MKRLLLTSCFVLSVLFVSAQFMVLTTVNQPDKDKNEDWGMESFTDNMGFGYQVNDNWTIGGVRNGDEDFEMMARYMHSENFFVGVQAPLKDASDNADIMLGYSFNAFSQAYLEPKYSIPVQADANGDREGEFSLGLAWRF